MSPGLYPSFLKRMEKMGKTEGMKKKTDIFSLYKKEFLVTISDDEGNETSLTMTKLTQGERQKILNDYLDISHKIRTEIQERDERTGYYTKSLDVFGKSQLIEGLISYEKSQRSQVADMYPEESESTGERPMSSKKREEYEEELLANWEKTRREELDKLEEDEIRSELKKITLESMALIESGKYFDYMALHLMCRDTDTDELIFKTKEDVERVVDKRVLDVLIKKLQEIRQLESAQAVRKTVESSDFLEPGESPKDSDDSQTTTV